MKILITGSRGMVGNSLIPMLKDHELLTPTKAELNVSRLSQVMKYEPDFIIHLAAETDHEYCEENAGQCYLINTIGSGNMKTLARHLNIPIIYISAASIFNGSKGTPYSAYDEPLPFNHYNLSKFYGEQLIRLYRKSYVLRIGWLFGGGPTVDKKFVYKLLQKIERGERKIRVCTDCFGSPTYSKDLAERIKFFCENTPAFGIYNCANESEGVSRYDFAIEIVKILKMDIEIMPCKIDDLKDEFPCKRTNYEVLENNPQMRHWKLALKEYLDAYYRH